MKEQLITFETAKLAKEKGFNILTRNHWSTYDNQGIENNFLRKSYKADWNEKNIPYVSNKLETLYSAPTQSLLQKWLREVYDIDITVNSNNESRINRLYEAVIYSDVIEEESNEFSWFKTYEGALEDGLLEALKLIP